MTNPFRGKTVTLEEVWKAYQRLQPTTFGVLWDLYNAPILVRKKGTGPWELAIKNPPPADQAEDGEKDS